MDGGSPCRMAILRNVHVALSSFKKNRLCRPVDFKKASCRHVYSKKVPCCMSLKPKKDSVAVLILGVYTPVILMG